MSIYLGQNQLDGGTVVVPEAEVRHLLWENPSPTTDFTAQTLSNLGDLSDYLYVDVEFAPFADTARCINRFIVGTNGVLFYMYLNTTTNSSAATMINGVSRAIQVTSSSIIFGNGQMVYNGSAYVDWANRAIPTRIWGVTNATAVTVTQDTSGTNSNGSWVRFADGTQICWKDVTLGEVDCSTAWGSVYESGYLNMGNWPIAFSNTPRVFVQRVSSTSSVCMLEATRNVSSTSAGQTIWWRPNSATCTGVIVCIMGIGRWK